MAPNGSTGIWFFLLAVPLAAGALFSAGGTWGFDHLHRLPVWVGAGLLLLTVAVWIPPGRRVVERAAGAIGRRLEAAPLRLPLLLALLGGALFALLPIATRIYGDSRYILDDHAPGNLMVHLEKMLTFGLLARGRAGFALHDLLSRLSGLTYEQTFQL
ncbi:MAG: hypothetical protein GF346_02280, partial [Candidatus Eisenbacteria bacterium]|nr:hypothetical protein [Candidatus Latescibacterota bacterium]MBD3301255.1 hypothetical protein [Candidatus Eisenbacteria bacterium]